MSEKYFDKTIINAINQYINAKTLDEKNKIINYQLFEFLRKTAEAAIKNIRRKQADEDEIFELIEHVIINTLPRIDAERILAAPALIYKAMQNKVKSNILAKRNIFQENCKVNISDNEELEEHLNDYYSNDFDTELQRLDLRKEVIKRIDQLIEEQQVLNKRNTLILCLLRQYVVDNNFDVAGFRAYCIKEMNINKQAFWNCMSTLNIRSQIFSEKLIYKTKNYNRRK